MAISESPSVFRLKVKSASYWDVLGIDREKFTPLRVIPNTSGAATVELVFSPLWVPAKAIVFLASAVLDILSLGSFSARDERYASLRGRVKVIGCEIASIIILPATMLTEIFSCFSHLDQGNGGIGIRKIDKILIHMWTGGLYL